MEAVRIADQRTGYIGREMAGQLEAFLVRPHRENLDGFLDKIAQVEFNRLQLNMAGLDLRKVQNVVNQLKKAATGTPEDPEVLSLVRRQLCIPEQIGHADDGVHRSADLMADSGQKLAFGLVGHFSRLLGKEQRLLGDGMFDRFA